MSNNAVKWRVTFIDAGNCPIKECEVECYRMTSAPKLAIKMMSHEERAVIQAEGVALQVVKV